MRWFDVDGAREYLSQNGGKKPSRKVIYLMANAGLKVSRDGKRLYFCSEWIDEYLIGKAKTIRKEVQDGGGTPPCDVQEARS
jgi:hypothetical protein